MHSLIHISSQDMSVLHNFGNKYIFSGQGGYGLDHYLILSWDGTTEWAAWSQSSCHVDNRKALYYIRYFVYDPTTTTTSTTSISSTTATSSTTTTTTTTKGYQGGGNRSGGSFSSADAMAIDLLMMVVVLVAYCVLTF